MAPPASSVVSIGILEKDSANEEMIVWEFPSLTPETKKLIIARTSLDTSEFIFSKCADGWLYTQSHELTSPNEQGTVAFAVCLIATVFHPERYAAMLKILSNEYSQSFSPPKVLEGFLGCFTKGSFSFGDSIEFDESKFDPRRAFLATSIKDIVRLFNEDVVYIWSALLMKKRIAVLSDSIGTLLTVVRGFPLFVWHRQNWSLLRPYVTTAEEEINELSQAGIYVAGFTEEAIKDRQDLWDILVDVNGRSVIVADAAKEQFGVGSVHKDIITLLMGAVNEADTGDQAVIKSLALKTKNIVTKLTSLKSEHEDGEYVDMEDLEELGLAPPVTRFLYAVATAEGLVGE